MRSVVRESEGTRPKGMKLFGPLTQWTVVEVVIAIALGIVLSQVLMIALKTLLLANGLEMIGVDPMR